MSIHNLSDPAFQTKPYAIFIQQRHLGKGSYSDVFEVVMKDTKTLKAEEYRVGNDSVSSGSSGSSTNRRRLATRRRSTLSASINVATLSRPAPNVENKSSILAIKCLRPQIRSDIDEFTIGAEDLVHETAMLASLCHPNIIKLHGRASGNLANAFGTDDGYFILLDKLNETLNDRIKSWKQDSSSPVSVSSSKCNNNDPLTEQLDVAHTISKAMTYLHAKKIIFRDLKPDNVGFDSNGVLKLFDFGFAIGLPEKTCHSRNGMVCPGKVFERCGTPRYMAPEVGLETGYCLSADVYSFGILLWEICSLNKAFGSFKSIDEFEAAVFHGGTRPTIETHWPNTIKHLMMKCWASNPDDRPGILTVSQTLASAMPKKGVAASSRKPARPHRRLSMSMVGGV